MRDLSRLDTVMRWIVDHPEEHDQGAWVSTTNRSACGTAKCVAGHAVAMFSERFDVRIVQDGWGYHYVDLFWAETPNVVQESGNVWFAEGQELLGLTMAEASSMFAACNTLDELQIMQKNLHNGAPIMEGIRI